MSAVLMVAGMVGAQACARANGVSVDVASARQAQGVAGSASASDVLAAPSVSPASSAALASSGLVIRPAPDTSAAPQAASSSATPPDPPSFLGALTPIELVIKNPRAYDHKRLTLRGVADMGRLTRQRSNPGVLATRGGPMCTLLWCASGNNDCNQCNSDALLASSKAEDWSTMPPLTLRGAGIDCGGMGSNIVCNPRQGVRLEVVGKLEIIGPSAGQSDEIYVVFNVEKMREY